MIEDRAAAASTKSREKGWTNRGLPDRVINWCWWKEPETIGQGGGRKQERFPFFDGMTSDLPMIENQRKRIGQHPNHDQQHKSIALVDGWMFQMAIDSDGLKYFSINAPSAAGELMGSGKTN